VYTSESTLLDLERMLLSRILTSIPNTIKFVLRAPRSGRKRILLMLVALPYVALGYASAHRVPSA